jgi:hypothetical protein
MDYTVKIDMMNIEGCGRYYPNIFHLLTGAEETMKTSNRLDINPQCAKHETRATTTTMQHSVWKYVPDSIKIRSHHVISPMFQILQSLVFKNQGKWRGILYANICPITSGFCLLECR